MCLENVQEPEPLLEVTEGGRNAASKSVPSPIALEPCVCDPVAKFTERHSKESDFHSDAPSAARGRKVSSSAFSW